MVVARLLALAALALTATAAAGTPAPASSPPVAAAVRYLEQVQRPDGGFAEAGRAPDVPLTAWSALALVAAEGSADARARVLSFLRGQDEDKLDDGAFALHAVALAALGDRPVDMVERLRTHRPGALVNATVWTVLALRALDEAVPGGYVRAILAAQHRSGGWSWARRGAPDSNDTAAALQALRAAGVSGAAVRRGVAALAAFRNPDGGYGLTRGRPSDAQSTAWAIQALLAVGAKPGKAPFRFLASLRRPDGSYRYSTAYATTPVWVTAQVVPALAGRPYPFAAAR
jgi:hypothetical protein